MIPHRRNPAISFQVYFKNGIQVDHRGTPGLPRGCSREPSASIFPTKVALRALSSDYVNPSLRSPGAAGS
jgi:hypothetical protein